jgi:uncharacterized protein YndB with AHSA1/START domain
MPDFTESITIEATPDRLYALVSDLPRMGDWSPECTRVTWTSATTCAVAGARFIGHNRAGVVRWFTQGEVLEASPGHRFAFRIHFGPIPIAVWRYDFTPTVGGCELTESWTDHRPTPRLPLALRQPPPAQPGRDPPHPRDPQISRGGTLGGRRDARWSNRWGWLRVGRLGGESGWHALKGCRQRWSVWC